MLDTYIERITTIEMCDHLLAGAEKNKILLERKRRNLGERVGDLTEQEEALTTELADVLLAYQVLTDTYEKLPPGPERTKMGLMIDQEEIRKAQLQRQLRYSGAISVLNIQKNYNITDSQIVAANNYIQLLQDKRSQLLAAGA